MNDPQPIRRNLVQLAGLATIIPATVLAGCGSSDEVAPDAADASDSGSTSSDTGTTTDSANGGTTADTGASDDAGDVANGSDGDTGTSSDTNTDAGADSGAGDETGTGDDTTTDTTSGSDSGSSTGSWASGDTSLIQVGWPADSIFRSASACVVQMSSVTTLGPCYFQSSTGEDISLGLSGLPMQFCLQLIDSQCAALSGYSIEIWHCDVNGLYSGDTSNSADASRFAGSFCTGGDATAEGSTWYRGMLVTNSSGRVNFKTCFPGWYRGRTIHFHVRVTDPLGVESVITQFCFTDELAREVCTTHDRYLARGEQDTPLAGGRDGIFGTGGSQFILNTQRNSDNTMLAFQTVQIV